ncbi:MAG: pentapeptide repeat-containing protein [Cyanobacteriota bacterium]|nr:pentapeptide repeat-containing protein [Cyanobacteriota bacterium]
MLVVHRSWLSLALLSAVVVIAAAAQASSPTALLRLLEHKRCPGCSLQDADLVHADLRDADLRKAQLQRANLSRARLDGANLQGADLRFISLKGASLRGANLRQALLDGADLRQSDLSGALLDPGALSRTHWDQAIGVTPQETFGYAELHNAGVKAAEQGRFTAAETFFSDAIHKQPLAAVSWLARGICRSEQGKTALASADFAYAANLYEQAGEVSIAAEIKAASEKLKQPEPGSDAKGGNGKGMQAVSGAVTALKILGPIAAKAFIPIPF